MRTLVLVENNLTNDNRVKRHIQAMLDLGHDVTVLARPVPDSTPGMTHDRLKLVFWQDPSLTLQPRRIRELAQKLQLSDQLFRTLPALFASDFSDNRLRELSRNIQTKQIDCSWWEPFANHIPCEDTPGSDSYHNIIAFFEFMMHWGDTAQEYPADIVYCNDLLTLIAGAAHKNRFGSRLIFDAHEIYYDLVPNAHTRLWKESMALLELHLVQFADCVIGVSQSHVDWMRQTYDRFENIICLPNCFGSGKIVEPPPPRPPRDPLRIYYHGASDRWRGLDNIVRALPEVPAVTLTLRCFPSQHLEDVKDLSAALGVADRLHVRPLVDSEKMIAAIRDEADVGIHACAMPTAANIKVGLSNKFIEYLIAGIPIITSPLEEQARIVRDSGIGCVLEDNTPEQIRSSLEWMVNNRNAIPEMGQRAYMAGVERFSWSKIQADLQQALTGSSM